MGGKDASSLSVEKRFWLLQSDLGCRGLRHHCRSLGDLLGAEVVSLSMRWTNYNGEEFTYIMMPLVRSTVVVIVLRRHTLCRICRSEPGACGEAGDPGVSEWGFSRLGRAAGGFGRVG